MKPLSAWEMHGEPIAIRLSILFMEGHSCATIATTLSEEFNCKLTKNSIIGKANRMGLVSPNGPGLVGYNEKQKLRVKPVASPKRKRRPPPPPIEMVMLAVADVVPRHIRFDELSSTTCRYPFGEIPPFTFCGCASVPGRPYCQPHEDLCASQTRGRVERPAEAVKWNNWRAA